MSGLMYSRSVLNSALFSFTLRQFMLRILRFCFYGRSYGRRCAEEFVSGCPLGILRVNWFKTAGVYWTKSVFRMK